MFEMEIKLPLVESLILASPEPLPPRKIAEVVDNISTGDIDEIVESLNQKYLNSNMSFRIRKIAGGYQVYIVETFARHVEELLTRRRSIRMTRAALETLAIIAYRQPVTKMDIEMIRGVASDSVIHTLLERKLVTMAGRAESVGRPLLYKTTDEFLKFFNLNSIDDLPKMQEIEELLASRDGDSQQSLSFEAERDKAAEDAGDEDDLQTASDNESDTDEDNEPDIQDAELDDNIETAEEFETAEDVMPETEDSAEPHDEEQGEEIEELEVSEKPGN